jgi:hypothetical protein
MVGVMVTPSDITAIRGNGVTGLETGTMAGKKIVIARYDGVSATGTSHGLLIETAGDGTTAFTVMGHDGKKRHAAVTLPDTVVAALIDALRDHLASTDTDDLAIIPWEEFTTDDQ